MPDTGIQLLIVGNRGYTSIGESFEYSASRLGLQSHYSNVAEAQSASRLVNALRWRFCQRRPMGMRRFEQALVDKARLVRPAVMLVTGFCPVSARVLKQLRAEGVQCVQYSCDDPWNRGQIADWSLESLTEYDFVFTPRTRNLDDLRNLGCRRVEWLPFAYDERLLEMPIRIEQGAPAVLFVGGADRDRVRFVRQLARYTTDIRVVGGYWERFNGVRSLSLGVQSPERVAALTRAASVNLCLVRRANRDGHVMRSFEAAALGACMAVEDTAEHRLIFGDDGECVRYFDSVASAAGIIVGLLESPADRTRMAETVRQRMLLGGHSYTDRLRQIIAAVRGGSGH